MPLQIGAAVANVTTPAQAGDARQSQVGTVAVWPSAPKRSRRFYQTNAPCQAPRTRTKERCAAFMVISTLIATWSVDMQASRLIGSQLQFLVLVLSV
jgi:hypothetical protein